MRLSIKSSYRAAALGAHTAAGDGAVGPGEVVGWFHSDQLHRHSELPGNHLANLRVDPLTHLDTFLENKKIIMFYIYVGKIEYLHV